MSISIQKRRYFTKRDQFKTKEYVYIYYQDPKGWEEDSEGFVKPKREARSCGEVSDPYSWIKAEQKLREIFERKLQYALDNLKEKRSRYIQEEDEVNGD